MNYHTTELDGFTFEQKTAFFDKEKELKNFDYQLQLKRLDLYIKDEREKIECLNSFYELTGYNLDNITHDTGNNVKPTDFEHIYKCLFDAKLLGDNAQLTYAGKNPDDTCSPVKIQCNNYEFNNSVNITAHINTTIYGDIHLSLNTDAYQFALRTMIKSYQPAKFKMIAGRKEEQFKHIKYFIHLPYKYYSGDSVMAYASNEAEANDIISILSGKGY